MSVLITVHVQHVGGSLLSMEAVPLWGRIGNALVAPWRYLSRLVWPRDLAVLYPHPGGWPVAAVVAAFLALAGVLWLAFRLRGRRPWLLFGLGWFLVALLPVSGLVQIGWHAMADRFMYVPAVGLYVALVWTVATTVTPESTGFSRLRHATGMSVGGTLLLGLLTVGTRHQLSFWRSSTALFQHAVDVTADNWMMENCLGVALERDGRLAEAEPHIRRAIRLKPDRYRAYYNLGCLAVRQGRHAVAEQAFRDALARHPGHVASRYNLAVTLAAQGRVAPAVDELRAILAEHPRNVAALNNLACWLRDLGREDEALACFRRTVETAPDYVTGRFNYGVTLLQLGRPAEAQVQFLETLRRDPAHAGAATGLARARANLAGDRRD
jgi:protein O-mannosyl-transferase